MTTEHQPEDLLDQKSTDAADADPIGPIELPKRSRIGARAMALVGSAGLAALAVQAVIDGTSTDTTISHC